MKKLLFTATILLCVATICSAQNISTFAGIGINGYYGDGGQATAAELSYPYGMYIDANGNIFSAMAGWNTIRKINSSGIIITVAGNGIAGNSGDGGPATAAEINNPIGVCLDASGNIYIGDEHNARIRKVNTAGIIITVAGNGIAGYSGDGSAATAAELNYPAGVFVDNSGNLFIADYYNSCVRKVNTSGIISTIAGIGGISGYNRDGIAATNAQLNFELGVWVDAAGNVYITDTDNDRVRKINTSGIITTIIGNGVAGFSGDGGLATAAEITYTPHLFIDASDNIYLADRTNGCIRKINTSGIISTIAGIGGIQGYSGDGGPATAAELNNPCDVVLSPSGRVFINDEQNHRIRVIDPTNGEGITEIKKSGQLNIFPSPANQTIIINLGDINFNSGNITITDITGKNIISQNINKTQSTLQMDVSNLATGMYFVQIVTNGQPYIGKFIVTIHPL